MKFSNLEQRIAQSYINLLPPFVPDKVAIVSVAEQERFYNIIKAIYRLAYDEPLLFVPTLHEDDAYPGVIKSYYGKPELQVNMKKFSKAVDGLLLNMYRLGQGEDIKFSKRQKNILARVGIENLADLPPAWRWLATRSNTNLAEFSFGLFDKNYSYTSDVYALLLGEAGFRKLESYMTKQGYKLFNIYNITASDCKLSLTYANPAWSKEPPNGGFEYKIRHTGISARYDFCFQEPVFFGLCIPNGLKVYLDAFDTASDNIKDFITENTKQCDGCRYCVQTDKTGTRPLAKIAVSHKGKTYQLCPYFPGYSYRWTSINEELAEQLIEMLAFMDRFLDHKKSVCA